MPFTAPETDLKNPSTGGFTAPETDLQQQGFTAPQEDVAKHHETLANDWTNYDPYNDDSQDLDTRVAVIQKRQGMSRPVSDVVSKSGEAVGGAVKGAKDFFTAPFKLAKQATQTVLNTATGNWDAAQKHSTETIAAAQTGAMGGVDTAKKLAKLGTSTIRDVSGVARAAIDRIRGREGKAPAGHRLGGWFTADNQFTPEEIKARLIEMDAERKEKGAVAHGDIATGKGNIMGTEGMKSPEALKEAGHPIDPHKVESMSVGFDPVNYIPGLNMPGADAIGGRALKAAGTASEGAAKGVTWLAKKAVPKSTAMRVASGAAGGAGAIEAIPHLIAHPGAIPAAAAAVGSVLAAKHGGRFLKQAGKEMLGEALPNADRGIFMSGAHRLVKGGAHGSASMIPFALAQDTPEEAAGSLATGAAIGAGFGAIKNPVASRFANSERTRTGNLSTEAFDYNSTPDLDGLHRQAVASMTPEQQSEINQIRHLTQDQIEYYVLPPEQFDARANEAAGGEVSSQGFFEDTGPNGKRRVFVKQGVQDPIQTGWHEIGHKVTENLSPTERAQAIGALVRANRMDEFTARYLGNLYGTDMTGTRWEDLPATKADAEASQMDPQFSKEYIGEELLSETTAALMRGQPIDSVAGGGRTNKRILQQFLGRIAEAFGYKMGDQQAQSILGVNPSFTAAAIIEGALKKSAPDGEPTYQGDLSIQNRITQLEPIAARQITPDTTIPERKAINDAKRELDSLRKDITPKTDFPAAGPAPVPPSKPTVPKATPQEQAAQRRVRAFIKAQTSGLDEATIAQIASEFSDPSTQALDILKRVAEHKMKAREEIKPQVPQGAVFTAPDGTKRTVTGAVTEPAKPGDFIADDKGNVRRVVSVRDDGTLSVVFSGTEDVKNTMPVASGRYAVLSTQPHDPSTVQSAQPSPALPVPTSLAPQPKTSTAQPQPSPSAPKKGPIVIPEHPGEAPDILDFVAENGGVHIPEPGQRKQEHDEFTKLPGVYAPLASVRGAVAIDQMAQMAHDKGLIPDGSPHTLAEELSKAAASRTRIRKQGRDIDAEEKRAKNFHEDAAKQEAGDRQFTADELQVGDQIQMGDEILTVKAIDPETFDVTLDDGDTYGRQVVEGEQTIYAKKVKTSEPVEEDPWSVTDAPPARQEPRHTPESIKTMLDSAEAQARAKETGKPSKAAEDRIRRAKVKAILDAIGTPEKGLQRHVDEFGTETIRGEFDPKNPLHTALAELGGGISPEASKALQETQKGQGQARYIRYRSAKSNTVDAEEGKAEFGMNTRKGEYSNDPASEREQGTVQHKVIVPMGTEMTKDGRPIARFYTLDNLLHNADEAFQFADKNGIDHGYSKDSRQRETQLFQDAQAYAENHAHGYTGDGKPIKQFPDSDLPRPSKDFVPTPIPENRLAFLNMLFHDESSTTSSRHARKVAAHDQKKAAGEKTRKPADLTPKARAAELETATLAQENNRWIDPLTGETNRIRSEFNAKGFDFGDRFKSPIETLSPEHIVEISDKPLKLQEGDTPSVRPTGFTTDPAQLAARGLPRAKAVRAAFMPEDTGKPGESEIPSENLAREAEDAGVVLSVATLKGLIQGDEKVKEYVRSRIRERTGKPARFQPKTSPDRKNPKREAADRIRMASQEDRKRSKTASDPREAARQRIQGREAVAGR